MVANLWRWTSVAMLVALAGCGGGSGVTITIERDSIQSALAKYFPRSSDKDGNKPIRVTLTDPEVLLEQGSSQLGLRVKVLVERSDEGPPPRPGNGPPFKPGPPDGGDEPPPRTFEGTVVVRGDLTYEPQTSSFHITNAKIAELKFPKLPPVLEAPVRTAAEAVMTKYLKENAIYTLPDDNVKSRAAKSVLKSIAVKDGKLEVVIGW